MRRRAYPYGRYLIKDDDIEGLGLEFRGFIKEHGFHISKYDEDNEGEGVLLVAVNKKVTEQLRQKKPPGRLSMLFRGLSLSIPSFKEMDEGSQRVGVELYLWPIEEGTLLEVFVLPYMSIMDHEEIFHLTESEEEQVTDWYLCEQVWEHIIPEMEEEFDLERVYRRG